MNERIKELATEASVAAVELKSKTKLVTELGKMKIEIPDTFIEQFSEMIVRECVEVAVEQKKWVEDQQVFDARDADWNKARIQQSQRIIDKIREHFGVEE